jgi:hypothetical protein
MSPRAPRTALSRTLTNESSERQGPLPEIRLAEVRTPVVPVAPVTPYKPTLQPVQFIHDPPPPRIGRVTAMRNRLRNIRIPWDIVSLGSVRACTVRW